jgi:hypothetical protein
MKAIVLRLEHALDIIDVVRNSREGYGRINEAIKWLTYDRKDVNPFDVFDQQEKWLIVEALEHAAASYRQVGGSSKLERAKKFEAIAQQARRVGLI